MAEVVFSPEELSRVDEICRRLDPAKHELTKPFLDRLAGQRTMDNVGFDDDKGFVTDQFRRALRDELLAGAIALAVYDAGKRMGRLSGDPRAVLLDDLRDNVAPNIGFGGNGLGRCWGRQSRRWGFNLNYSPLLFSFAVGCLPFEDLETGIDALGSLFDLANEEMFNLFGLELDLELSD